MTGKKDWKLYNTHQKGNIGLLNVFRWPSGHSLWLSNLGIFSTYVSHFWTNFDFRLLYQPDSNTLLLHLRMSEILSVYESLKITNNKLDRWT